MPLAMPVTKRDALLLRRAPENPITIKIQFNPSPLPLHVLRHPQTPSSVSLSHGGE